VSAPSPSSRVPVAAASSELPRPRLAGLDWRTLQSAPRPMPPSPPRMPAPPAPLPSEAEVAQMYAVLQRYATAKDELVRVCVLASCSRAADDW
jgi:hypothetical protein